MGNLAQQIMERQMLRTLAVLFVAALASCAAPHESVSNQLVTSSASKWMVGSWSCHAGYFTVPQAHSIGHNAEATYILSEDRDAELARGDGMVVVSGVYNESKTSNGAAPVSYMDQLVIDPKVTVQDELLYSYSVEFSDLSKIEASGDVFGCNDGTCEENELTSGFLRFPGGVTTANSVSVGLIGSDGLDATPGRPREFFRNWDAQIGRGTFQLYHELDCTENSASQAPTIDTVAHCTSDDPDCVEPPVTHSPAWHRVRQATARDSADNWAGAWYDCSEDGLSCWALIFAGEDSVEIDCNDDGSGNVLCTQTTCMDTMNCNTHPI